MRIGREDHTIYIVPEQEPSAVPIEQPEPEQEPVDVPA